jgi:hypothetical protein
MPYTYKSEAGDRLDITRCDEGGGHLQIVVASPEGTARFVCVAQDATAEVVRQMAGYGRVPLEDRSSIGAVFGDARWAALKADAAKALAAVEASLSSGLSDAEIHARMSAVAAYRHVLDKMAELESPASAAVREGDK